MRLTMTEQILLITIWRLGDQATSVRIREHFAEVTGRDVAFGTIYNNMDQLVRKGFASSQKGDVTSKRGGRAKIYYLLTESGLDALEYAQALQSRLWAGISEGAFGKDK